MRGLSSAPTFHDRGRRMRLQHAGYYPPPHRRCRKRKDQSNAHHPVCQCGIQPVLRCKDRSGDHRRHGGFEDARLRCDAAELKEKCDAKNGRWSDEQFVHKTER